MSAAFEAEVWREKARALRAVQDMAGADRAIAEAARLAPTDPLTTFLRAQSAYELGHPAAALFAEAVRCWPENPDVLRNHALALASEGHHAEAEAVLTRALAARPDWLDGQRVLASLRYSHGDAETYDAGFAEAVRAQPRNQGLWLGWFTLRAQQRDWPAARRILDKAGAHLGETRALAVARAFLASECGALGEAQTRLAALTGADDEFLVLCRIRTALRAGDAAAARDLALPLTATRLAGQVWPYLSTAWRMLGDPNAAWLDGDPVLHGVLDPGLSAAEITDLAALLRRLHTASLPYAEQSVRHGTQTDRSILLRHEPLLGTVRARLMEALRDFVANLPPPDPRHPVLGRARGGLQISGSWSVRLGAGGFNVTHSHPVGWFSAVLYVALPDDPGAAPAGALHLGAPPPELGVTLDPYAVIPPHVGHVVAFPSILWHGTYPFAAGERLNIAFDVVPTSV
ncbi:tetratricopeptide repeat-containing 2OG-Fe(II) oxygenase [Novosphingobium sediminis]|uniref:Tetratricopeptide repeat-containing 2OG-Fe(II) oxygenase n=1 Tax=Novosphingobium sediminis TaxID=707214 RepID=A0A512AN26_9SPHN|nr:putative 2OG-Fe(II) oxygenase [Novosphingobium sediminis]GEO01122.1 tetratricopeptide repeat-containing 2OG-Fe(II) oxygenase [Novosphingobium sediminis]